MRSVFNGSGLSVILILLKYDGEGRAFAQFTFNFYFGAVQSADFVHYRKAQPRAAGIPVAARIGAIKSFEQSVYILLRDTLSVVLNGDVRPSFGVHARFDVH